MTTHVFTRRARARTPLLCPNGKAFVAGSTGICKKLCSLLFLLPFFALVAKAQQWEYLGSETQISSATAAFTSIAVVDDVPYVAYREGGSVGKVKKKNASGDWEQVGDNIGANVLYTRLFSDRNGNLYITYLDAANGSRLAVKTYNDETNTWQPLGNNSLNLYVSAGSVNNGVSQYSSTPRCSVAFDTDNNPYIAFGEGANLTPFVKKFDGTSWVPVGAGAVNPAARAVGVSLVVDEEDVPWLVFCSLTASTATTGTMAFYRFDNGVWSGITTPVTAAVRHTSMALNATNNPAVAFFNVGNSNRASVIVYNKTTGTWSSITSLASRDSPNITLLRDASGNLYCSFVDAFSSSTFFSVARVFKQHLGATAWVELREQSALRGIDEPVGNLMMAVGSDTARPFIVYTKTNTSSVVTPIARQFKPAAAPIGITTHAVSQVTYNSATSGGNITSDGGLAVTERGLVYSTTNANPSTSDTKLIDGSTGLGSYALTLTGLSPASIYYVRAYAINEGGTSYGAPLKFITLNEPDPVVTTPMQMERLDRGLVAVRKGDNEVYVGWRLFGTDPSTIAFNVYRDGVKLNNEPITQSTNFIDHTTENGQYTVKAIINGEEQHTGKPVAIWSHEYLDIPLQKPAGGVTPDGVAYTYTANDASVGDLDGDGEYEVILKWDPTNAKDNSQSGYTGNVYLDAYKMNGTRLWRIDLGRNIRAGAHYTQFMVYDLDGDGKAEVACKTADATIDGKGIVIGNPLADYRNSGGYILSGPEFLTIFNGETGAAMATTDYVPARGNVGAWGDTYGNRVDRFIAAVAYLDGARPSLVMGRGYYTRQVRAAWDWRNGQLTLRWVFDTDDGSSPINSSHRGQGNHQMTIGDTDGDGKQEVFNGSSAVNDNGKGMWTNGLGHGDALHMTDMDPDRPGQEIWMPYESPGSNGNVGAALIDAKTGERIFWVPEASADVGRGLAADIDPRHKGYEMWASRGGLYNAKGEQIGTTKPSMNFAIWWDGDLSRELLDGTTIQKWNYLNSTRTNLLSPAGVSSNNSTKATPALSADIFGDWREEVIFRSSDNEHLRIYTTTIPTEHRIYTLMHDPQYRTAIAWQNSAYNQPPHPGFFLGTDMDAPPVPNIEYVADAAAPVAIAKNIIVTLQNGQAVITPADVDGGSYDLYGIGNMQLSKSQFGCADIGDNQVTLTVTDYNGNSATANAIVTILGAIPANPSIAVTRNNNTHTGEGPHTIVLGYGAQSLTLTASQPNAAETVSYSWSPSGLLSSDNMAAPVFTPTAAGKYAFWVTATNQYGCMATSAPMVPASAVSSNASVEILVVDARCGTTGNKVLVCHRGKEICIDATSVQDHLGHGCRLGSCSRGVQGTLAESAIVSSETTWDSTIDEVKIYPNPAAVRANVGVWLAQQGSFTLAVYDARGVLVKVVATGQGNNGWQNIPFSTGNLSKGAYYIRLSSASGTITRKLVVK